MYQRLAGSSIAPQPAGQPATLVAGLEPVDDKAMQDLVRHQLPQPFSTLTGKVVGDEREVARIRSFRSS
jgi:hypothetical protein